MFAVRIRSQLPVPVCTNRVVHVSETAYFAASASSEPYQRCGPAQRLITSFHASLRAAASAGSMRSRHSSSP